MTGVTVASVRKQIAASETAARMQALGALDDRRRAAVLDMIAGLRPNATVDVDSLLRAASARVGAEAMGLTDEEREHVRASLAVWRAECSARGLVGDDSATAAKRYAVALELDAAPATTTTVGVVEPDPEPDDELDDRPEPQRKPIKRVRVGDARRARRSRSRAVAAPDLDERTTGLPSGLYGRCLGPGADSRPLGQSVDFNPHAWTPPPPWLLSSGDEPEENDDVAA